MRYISVIYKDGSIKLELITRPLLIALFTRNQLTVIEFKRLMRETHFSHEAALNGLIYTLVFRN